MIQAAKWRNIDQYRLSNEYTYYERHCDASDLTTRNLDQLLSQNNHDNNNNDDNNPTTATTIAYRIVRHGMTVLPSPMLTDDTMDELRSFILDCNAELTQSMVLWNWSQ